MVIDGLLAVSILASRVINELEVGAAFSSSCMTFREDGAAWKLYPFYTYSGMECGRLYYMFKMRY